MSNTMIDQEEPSGLSRFAIAKGSAVTPLRADLVADYEAAVKREHFDFDGEENEE